MIDNKTLNAEMKDAKSYLNVLLEKLDKTIVLFDAERNVLSRSRTAIKRNVSVHSNEITPVRNAQGELIGYLYVEKNKSNKPMRDHLTGVVGREGLEEEFLTRNRTRKPNDRGFSLIFIDLDRFKPVNEMFGHLVGDQVLLQFAALLKNSFRPTDLVARYGGDEFVVLCDDCPTSVVEKRVRDFQKRLAGQYVKISFPESHEADQRITLGFSFGLTAVEPDDSFAAAVNRADVRLLKVKRKNGNSTPVQ